MSIICIVVLKLSHKCGVCFLDSCAHFQNLLQRLSRSCAVPASWRRSLCTVVGSVHGERWDCYRVSAHSKLTVPLWRIYESFYLFSVAAYFIYKTFKMFPMGFWVAGGHMQQDQLQGGGHGPSSPWWTFYSIMSQLILNQIQLFYCQMQFATVACVYTWSLEVVIHVTSQLDHMWDKTVTCASFLFGRWLQSEKPGWSLSGYNGQVSFHMPLKQTMPTYTLHFAQTSIGSFADQVPCFLQRNRPQTGQKCCNISYSSLHFVLPKGYWQSSGGPLWRRPASHHDDWPQHGRRHRSSHGCCQSCTLSAWPLCDWCCRRWAWSPLSQRARSWWKRQTKWQMVSMNTFWNLHSGTAMDALNSMQNFLRSRPKSFKSLENAIEWR